VETASWIQVKDDTLRVQIETLMIKFLKRNAVINKQNVQGRILVSRGVKSLHRPGKLA
jgi:hypothetical protein